MKKLIATAVLCAIPATAVFAGEDPLSQRANDSREVIQQFAQQLQGELGRAMGSGGPVAAIEVCQQEAPGIAAAMSSQHGWTVGRTTDKLRNPDNAPDAWEAEVLAQFAERIEQGEPAMGMSHYEVVSQNGREVFRFMSAIGMPPMEQAPCLMCHGTDIRADVKAKLDELYPNDQALNYRPGMLRGAFTISQPMD